MQATLRCRAFYVTLGLILTVAMTDVQAQRPTSPAGSTTALAENDPLAELSPENRALFDSLRNAARRGDDAATLQAGRKLLPSLKAGTRLSDLVVQLTAGSAVETGDTAYALSLLKPFTDAHPDDWRAASLLARVYAETDDKAARDRQIGQVIALHKNSSDPDFAKLHIFPIQKVALHSGYAIFLYPFEPVGKFHTYLVAFIYTSSDKQDYRMELESDDVDQAFFKPKHPGERRFSIDTYRSSADGKPGESQALHGFIDGPFNYDTMRDRMVEAANAERPSGK